MTSTVISVFGQLSRTYAVDDSPALVSCSRWMTSAQMVIICHPLFFPCCFFFYSVMFLQFVPKTHLFFTAGKDRRIKQWDADKFEHIQTLEVTFSDSWTAFNRHFSIAEMSFPKVAELEEAVILKGLEL